MTKIPTGNNVGLAGKVAIVTGGARGIGRATALRLGRTGCDVVVADINLAAALEFPEGLNGKDVSEELERLGVRSIGVQGDITQSSSVAELVRQTLAVFGRIDVLVNNAGGALTPVKWSKASEMSRGDIAANLKLNLLSSVELSQAVLPTMQQQRSGAIVNISSIAALHASRRDGSLAPYALAKSALIQFTRQLAQAVGPDGIRVNCIACGTIQTARIAALAKSRNIGTDAELAAIPLQRLGTPEDIAGVVEFFVSDAAAYVTGQCLSVCGGSILFPN